MIEALSQKMREDDKAAKEFKLMHSMGNIQKSSLIFSFFAERNK